MKYYKLISDDNFIGAVTSNNFVSENSRTHWLLSSNEEYGQFVIYQNNVYRDYWMAPIIDNSLIDFTNVKIIEILENEYDIYIEAINNNQPIYDDNPNIRLQTELTVPEQVDEDATVSIEFIRTSKTNEMSRTCNQMIEAGFDIELGGKIEHFSLTTQDQLNLISLSSMAANGMEAIPYHADGEICRFYSNAEMQAIVARATAFKIYHTTYFNALKNYINSLDTIEAIAAITYGVELPEAYQSDVLKSLQQ